MSNTTAAPSSGISTPSRPRPSVGRSDSSTASCASASSPLTPAWSALPPEGYSYLARSSSISTPTRSRPKGLASNTASPALANRPSLTDLKEAATKGIERLQRRKTLHAMPISTSLPQINGIGSATTPSQEAARLADAVAKLPTNPKGWTPSQVALYLTHVLGLVPRPIVEDVTAYVRSSHMGGRVFLRLSERDLEMQGLNLKWRRLMIEAVRKLRRDALRGRIWGFEGGSVKWPRKHDFDHQLCDHQGDEQDEDEDCDDGNAAMGKDGIVRSSKGVSKLTLKRMRDSKKVQGMIQAFQLSPQASEKAGLSEEDMTALGIDQIKKGHVSTRTGSNDSEPLGSPRAQIPAVFGEGFVRGQAGSYECSSEAEWPDPDLPRLRQSRSTSHFALLSRDARETGRSSGRKNDIFDDLLASVSDQEAAELASELDLEDLQDPDRRSHANAGSGKQGPADSQIEEVALVPRLDRYARESQSRTASEGSTSICSASESEPDGEEAGERDLYQGETRFGQLDADVIKSIMGEDSIDMDASRSAANADETEESAAVLLPRSRTTGSLIARPERPYRASLYTDEELLSLERSSNLTHLRTESSAELAGELGSNAEDHPFLASPRFDTAKKRPTSTQETSGSVQGLFQLSGSKTTADATEASEAEGIAPTVSTAAGDDYVFELPDAVAAPAPRSQAGSMRKKLSGTYGSKRGKMLLSMLQTSAEGNGEVHSEGTGRVSRNGSVRLRSKLSGGTGGKTAAEDEEGWGGTLGRQSSRKSLASVYLGGTADQDGMASGGIGAGPAVPAASSAAASRTGSVAVRRRTLERVASEAEAEAWHAALDQAQEQEQAVNGGEAASKPESVAVEQPERDPAQDEALQPADRYEEPSVADTTPSTLAEKPSVERRLSDLLSASASVAAVDELAQPEEEPPVDLPPTAIGQELETAEPLHMVESQSSTGESEPPQDPTETPSSFSSEASDPVAAPPSVPIDVPPRTTSPEPAAAAIDADADAEADTTPVPRPSPSDQMLVPLTTLEPHPSGTGSIRKRSLVLVDRRRFESLARKMTLLEDQIHTLETQTHLAHASATPPALRDLFPADATGAQVETPRSLASQRAEHNDPPAPTAGETERNPAPRFSLFHPSSWTRYLSSLNPYFLPTSTEAIHQGGHEEEVEMTDTSLEEEEERALSLGAIPAYMLGLGAGVGFVLVREVVGKGLARR